MPTARFVAILAAGVIAPSLAAADTGRFGVNLGADHGHGDGSTIHKGVFVDLNLTHRLALELQLERITPQEGPQDGSSGDAATAFGSSLLYQLTRERRSITPVVRLGGAVENSEASCGGNHVRADVGLGADVAVDRSVYLGAEALFSRRWEGSQCAYADAARQPSYKRSPGDPWDDVELRLSLSIGF